MLSIKELYKIGHGPSSSHTMGPGRAARAFSNEYPSADRFTAILYGSLSKTGKGHRTDTAVIESMSPRPVKVIFSNEEGDLPHENTMDLIAWNSDRELARKRYMSIGGGDVRVYGQPEKRLPEIYSENSFSEIAEICKSRNMRLWKYVEEMEGPDIWDYLAEVKSAMWNCINHGLVTTGLLEGGLGVTRKAQMLYNRRHIDESDSTRENRIVCAYAFACGEENASAGIVVTAPTCGSCGVVPSVLRYMQEKRGFSDIAILRALATGGLIGNLIKHNASISGAECGCQAEIGSACSMASASLAELYEMGIDQIEYAAEVAMEHHLGLTCDPICGLVQIPCIERNAVAAMRAINALSLANFLADTRKISLDLVINTMYQTGRDLSRLYRETAEGGLARLYRPDI